MILGMELSVAKIFELYDVDLVAGDFLHKQNWGKARKGKKAGYVNKNGYRAVRVGNKAYYEHNLVWLVATGSLPSKGYELDHKNRDRTDNRLENLRLCTRSQNNINSKIKSNNTSGYKGVHWNKEKKKYCAQIRKDKKTVSLGYFDSAENAHKAALALRLELFGEFAELS